MLKALDDLDSEKIQRALSSLASVLLPSPSEDMAQRVKALPTLQRNVLREIREQLALSGDIPGPEEVPLVLDSLIQELSAAALSKADIDDRQARAFDDESKGQEPRERSRPRVFISSSTEGLGYAREIQANLEAYAICQIWDRSDSILARQFWRALYASQANLILQYWSLPPMTTWKS